MVTATVVLVLVAGDAIVEGDFACQSAFGEKFERAVDGGKSNARIALPHELVKLFSREMLVGLEKGEQDGIALLSLLQTDTFQVLMETLLRLAKGFPRNRYVVINALLKHPGAVVDRCSE